jgi:hypothetical protein
LHDIRTIFPLRSGHRTPGAFDDHHRACHHRGSNGKYPESDNGLESSPAEAPEHQL